MDSLQAQFAKVQLSRLDAPRVPAAALVSMSDCYKIKVSSSGFRLVYKLQDDTLVLLTIAVSKRDKSAVDAAEILRQNQPP
jgi:mRNA interferase RelE/StbE